MQPVGYEDPPYNYTLLSKPLFRGTKHQLGLISGALG